MNIDDSLRANLARVAEMVDVFDDHYKLYVNQILKLFINMDYDEFSIVKRAEAYFPRNQQYIRTSDCYAKWVGEDVIEFGSQGWRYHVIQYKHTNGAYHKIYTAEGNVNGRGQDSRQTYEGEPAMTSEEMLSDMGHFLSESTLLSASGG